MLFANCFARDGRIKVIGGDNIEAVLASPKQLPFKNLEVRFTSLLRAYNNQIQFQFQSIGSNNISFDVVHSLSPDVLASLT